MVRSEARSTKVGRFIRQQVIPSGMTVTEAARRLGVGRPALSNLLNGKSALSQDMALRLEGTFGADRSRLLELQAASDRHRRRTEDRSVAIGTYAPSFLTITARQIADWAGGNIRARDRFPVLLRRLIHASGRELRRVDFPGYDNAQRHGWDGQVEADAATPWVPEGKSFWEFGADRRPSTKAEKDYRDRLHALSAEERAQCTFVFVTPRNWEGKGQWVRSKEEAGDWKAVRALDASDLEQWLETTIAPRIWLAGELGIPPEGFATLDHFWDRWAAASDPPMSHVIFAPSVAAHLKDFRKWLDAPRPDRLFTVAGDSREEAVAFISCLLRHKDVPDHHRDRAVIFESASTLRTLAQSSSPFMPIVHSEATEREIATLYRQRHCIVVRPRNAVDRKPDATVELLSHGEFGQALADMGLTEREHVDRLANESGRSPTVLRRRLSQIPVVRTPPWAGDRGSRPASDPDGPCRRVACRGSRTDCRSPCVAGTADRTMKRSKRASPNCSECNDCPVWCADRASRGRFQDRCLVCRQFVDDRRKTLPVSCTSRSMCCPSPIRSSDVSEGPTTGCGRAGLPTPMRLVPSTLASVPVATPTRCGPASAKPLILLSVHENALFQDGTRVSKRGGARGRTRSAPAHSQSRSTSCCATTRTSQDSPKPHRTSFSCCSKRTSSGRNRSCTRLLRPAGPWFVHQSRCERRSCGHWSVLPGIRRPSCVLWWSSPSSRKRRSTTTTPASR